MTDLSTGRDINDFKDLPLETRQMVIRVIWSELRASAGDREYYNLRRMWNRLPDWLTDART